jgi:hypothetical protein
MLAGPLTAQGQDDLRSAGRKMAEEKGGAIVVARIVLSMKATFGGQQNEEQEIRREITGTVVRPDGTTIIPLSEIDPSEQIRRLSAGSGEEFAIDSQVKDLKLVVNRTEEIPATVVLRDPDLDIAILQPTAKPEKPMTAIDLSASAEPQMLEQCFVLARLGRIANYAEAAMTGEIQAIVEKPRKFYVPSAELASGGLGTPIFNAAGKLIGVVVLRVAPGSALDSGDDEPTLVTILPSADVKTLVDQAPEL